MGGVLRGFEMGFSSGKNFLFFFCKLGRPFGGIGFSWVRCRREIWAGLKGMLGFFFLGDYQLGFVIFCEVERCYLFFRNWQSLVNEYFTDARDWLDIVNDDGAKSKKTYWVVYLAYVSFACFVIGAAIGMFNFSTLNSGENHVGKEAITPAAAKTNDTTATTIDQQDRGHRAEEVSDAKHASTATATKEKIASTHAATASGVNAK